MEHVSSAICNKTKAKGEKGLVFGCGGFGCGVAGSEKYPIHLSGYCKSKKSIEFGRETVSNAKCGGHGGGCCVNC